MYVLSSVSPQVVDNTSCFIAVIRLLPTMASYVPVKRTQRNGGLRYRRCKAVSTRRWALAKQWPPRGRGGEESSSQAPAQAKTVRAPGPEGRRRPSRRETGGVGRGVFHIVSHNRFFPPSYQQNRSAMCYWRLVQRRCRLSCGPIATESRATLTVFSTSQQHIGKIKYLQLEGVSQVHPLSRKAAKHSPSLGNTCDIVHC